MVSSFLTMVYFLWVSVIKVTDPIDPYFNAKNFDFDDYLGDRELAVAMKKLFPVGTERAFVNQVLIKAGNAKTSGAQDPESDRKVFYHGFPNSIRNVGRFYNPVVSVEFDNNRVVAVFVHGEPVDIIIKLNEQRE